jgi:hypothetical protein
MDPAKDEVILVSGDSRLGARRREVAQAGSQETLSFEIMGQPNSKGDASSFISLNPHFRLLTL